MSRVLIDTQALIWFAQDASVLSKRALRHDLTLVSSDREFDAYGVRRIW